MSKFRVSFNVPLADKAEKAAEEAAKVVFTELNARFQDAIGSKAWAWPRETIRSTGGRVSSPRNIVDTGLLQQSNVLGISRFNAVFRWTTNYASFVHEGANIFPCGDTNRPRVNLPPRPWTSAVLGTEKIAGIEPYEAATCFVDVWKRAMERR